MSASIYWEEPIKRKCLKGVMAPSRFIASIEETFGHFPVRLRNEDLRVLHGMANTWGDPKDSNPYLNLIDLLEDKDMIELTVEY